MANNLFTLENFDNFSEQIDIDELYEKKRRHDENEIALFNKILNRIHVKIKTTARQRIDNQMCWFVVPDFILGAPKFNHAECVAYIIHKLEANKFIVKYTHPNLLLIIWAHILPRYARDAYRTTTGVELDEFGQIIKPPEEEIEEQTAANTAANTTANSKREYTPIRSYRPSGSLYKDDILNKIEEKLL